MTKATCVPSTPPEAVSADPPAATRRLALTALAWSAIATPIALAASAGTHGHATTNPDAELIRTAAEHIRNWRAFNADPRDSGPDNEQWVAYERTYEALFEAPPPKTIEGCIALSQAAIIEGSSSGEYGELNGPAQWWSFAIAESLAKMGMGV